jgi:hypothetical protein
VLLHDTGIGEISTLHILPMNDVTFSNKAEPKPNIEADKLRNILKMLSSGI